MKFAGKVRKSGDSFVTTIPAAVMEGMSLKDGEICQFDIERADYRNADEKRGG